MLVYYCKILKNDTLWNFELRIQIKNFFGKFYADTFSVVCATYILVYQKMIFQNTLLIQIWILGQQKWQKTLVIDSDMECENEARGAGEDFTGVHM